MAVWLEQIVQQVGLRKRQSHLPVDSTPSWKLNTYQHVWIKKKQFKYDDLSQFGLDKFMLSGSTVRMKISVSWKNSLDKRDSIDWINTMTRGKLIYGYTESPDLGLALAQMTCIKLTFTCPQYSFWALALSKIIDPVIHLVHLEEGAGQYLRKQMDIIDQSSPDT